MSSGAWLSSTSVVGTPKAMAAIRVTATCGVPFFSCAFPITEWKMPCRRVITHDTHWLCLHPAASQSQLLQSLRHADAGSPITGKPGCESNATRFPSAGSLAERWLLQTRGVSGQLDHASATYALAPLTRNE